MSQNMPADLLRTQPAPAAPGDPPDALLHRPEPDRAGWWASLCAHLGSEGFRVSTDVAPRRFVGGLANHNYLIRVNDAWVVLRRPPEGPLPPGAHDMRREHRLLSRLWRATPLAPRSVHYCDDSSVIGTPFQIIEFRPGIAIRGNSLAPLPPTSETASALAEMVVDTLARLHAIDCEVIGLGDLGRPEGFFGRTTAGWIGRCMRVLDNAPTHEARTVLDWLEREEVGDGSAPTLLHNDFKLDNILIDPATLKPVAVLDWDMGTRGNPLFDLATLLSYWTEPGDPPCMHKLAQMPTALPGFPARENIARAYADLTGRSLGQIKPYRVLTTFKLGVVFHQLHARYRNGEPVDGIYAGFGVLAEELFAFAIDIINDRIF